MNVLIVGLGSIAGKHIYALKKLEGPIRIYALRSKKNNTPAENNDVTDLFDVKNTEVKFDFAIISNPTSLHFETIEKLLVLQIPLFIEKPLFHTLDNADYLVTKCMVAGIKTYVACNLRFHPCLQFLKNYIDNKNPAINEVNVYCGSYLPGWRPGDFRSSYSAHAQMGGGVHLDLIHELDYTCWIFGYPKKVYKELRSNSTLAIDAVDFGLYVFGYPGYTTTITLNYYRKDAKRQIEILTEEGTIIADLMNNTIKLNDEVLYRVEIDKYHTYQEQMKYFVDALDNSLPLMNNIEEAFKILKICLQ